MRHLSAVAVSWIALAANLSIAWVGCVGSEPQVGGVGDAAVGDTGGADTSVGGDAAADGPIVDQDAADAAEVGPCGICDGGCYQGQCDGSRVVSLVMGVGHGCALLAVGEVWCWGSNFDGQSGQTPPSITSPVSKVLGLPAIKQIAAGPAHTCAVARNSSVYCWGENAHGALGHDAAGDLICFNGAKCQPTPAIVQGLTAAQVTAGAGNTCAVTTLGGVSCWGTDEAGVLGAGGATTHPDTFVPVQVKGLTSGFSSVSLSVWPGTAACAVDTANKLWCWGLNYYGELGHSIGGGNPVDTTVCPYNTGIMCNTTPQKVTVNPDGTGGDFDSVDTVLAGWTTCAVRLDGSLWCWGANPSYQFANGTTTSSPTPAKVLNLPQVGLFSGNLAPCAVTKSGTLSCWGDGESLVPGTAGTTACTDYNGGTHTCVATPMAVGAPAAATTLSVGYLSGGIVVGGRAYAWGLNNAGQLGHARGTSGDVSGNNPTPQAVQGLP